MIRTIIIEDELDVRQGLIKMLAAVRKDIFIVGETGYVSEALELIKINKPQLVLIDIELEDGTGFDVLKALSNTKFKIIFTTAYNQYAIKAFKYSAVDYLLKPISPIELKEAVNKSITEIESEIQFKELLELVNSKENSKAEKIVLKTANQRFVLRIKDIIRLEADTAYTIFITETQKIVVSKNLKFYQNLLDTTFIRCHQSHLVNSKHIKGLKNNELLLSNTETIPISIRKKTEILQQINCL